MLENKNRIEEELDLKLELQIAREQMDKERQIAKQKRKKYENNDEQEDDEGIFGQEEEYETEEEKFYSLHGLKDEEENDLEDETGFDFDDEESESPEKLVESLMKEMDDEKDYRDEAAQKKTIIGNVEIEDDYINELFNDDKEITTEEKATLLYNEDSNIDDTVEQSLDELARAELLRDPDNEEDEYITKSNKFQKYYTRGVGVVILFFAILIFLLIIYIQNYGSTTNNKQANDSLSSIYSDEEIDTIISQNVSLQEEMSELKNQISKLTAQSSAEVVENEQPTIAQPNEQNNVVENNTAQQNIPDNEVPLGVPETIETAPKPKSYVVQEKDTLYKISKKFYGNIQGYQKIMTANNLKDDTIIVGDELIIP